MAKGGQQTWQAAGQQCFSATGRTNKKQMMAATGGTNGGAGSILFLALALSVGGAYFVSKVKLGESEPGSPLLHKTHDYNVSTSAINNRFPGSEELHVSVRTDEKGGIKRPEVQAAIERFQAHMLSDPGLGGTKALPGVVRVVNRLTHNDDPRWYQLPDNAAEIGGLMFAYLASSPIPGALKEFVTPDENEANVVFFYKDHQADTVARIVALAEQGLDVVAAEQVSRIAFGDGSGCGRRGRGDIG
jgi:predicted RND superfamily exporter protein